jgi:hypothetical protein
MFKRANLKRTWGLLMSTGPEAKSCIRVREVKGIFRLINRDRSDNPTPFDSLGLTGQYCHGQNVTAPDGCLRHTNQLSR